MVIELRRQEDFDAFLERSQARPVLVFKHSTQCGISDAAFERFQSFMRAAPDVEAGVVLVLEDRPVSNAVEDRLGILHESPQAILIEKGRPVWNASHRAITEDALGRAFAGVKAG
jgi:bacillithiol system protein YtxJ